MTPTQRLQKKMSALPDRFKQTQGQPGGIRSIAPSARAASYSDPVERMRGKYFDNRQDVSRDRLERRLAQQQENVFNRLTMFKPVQGSSNLLQSRIPGGPSIADVYEASARKYGPTLSEIAGDIGYGFRQVGSALGQKFAAGELGIMGIAKGLYEQFTNRAAQAKDALIQGVNKLSDIDLEILKNKDQYKFLSKKPEIQEVETLQNTQMTELDKANIIRQNIEQLETTPVTETTTLPQQPPGFKVMPTGASASYFPGRYGATPVPNNIQQAQNPDELRRALMENTRPMPNNFPQEKPYLMQQDDYYYQDKERFSPQGNQYLYAAEGGSVDSRLNDLQKKTNNIYGTGILSVR